jgi:16S rRNA (cytosine967-C5)-methyltransferase
MMITEPGTASRLLAIRILIRWLDKRDFPDRLLPTAAEDRGFVMDLVFGTVRGWRRLEWAISRFVKRRPAQELRAALLLGAHQLLFMPDVADHAAIHATVEAVKRGASGQSGFVNAVLRNILRERDAILADLEKEPLAVRSSHPDVLVARWLQCHGPATTEALCAWNNEPADTVVAMMPDSGVTAEMLMQRWHRAGVKAHVHPANAECLVLDHGGRVESLEGYAEGLFVPQDPATLAAVELLEVKPGLSVLDACAAPGGKTAQIASAMRRQGKLVALEMHADRLSRLHENMRRLGLSDWVKIVQGDGGAAEPVTALGPFDRVLVDAPCSNTGVLRRRPDARWRFSEARIKTMVAQQRRLLMNLLPLLPPDGRLVYSTCSLEPEENQELVAAVCQDLKTFVVAGTRVHFPTRDGTDGAFACAICRKPIESAACSRD